MLSQSELAQIEKAIGHSQSTMGGYIWFEFEGLLEVHEGLLVVPLGEVHLGHPDERVYKSLVVIEGCLIVVDGGIHLALVETVGALQRQGHALEIVLVGVVEVLDNVLQVLGGFVVVLLPGGLNQVINGN